MKSLGAGIESAVHVNSGHRVCRAVFTVRCWQITAQYICGTARQLHIELTVHLHEGISHAISQIQSSQFCLYSSFHVTHYWKYTLSPCIPLDLDYIKTCGSDSTEHLESIFRFWSFFCFSKSCNELLQWIILVQINRKYWIFNFFCLFSVKKKRVENVFHY